MNRATIQSVALGPYKLPAPDAPHTCSHPRLAALCADTWPSNANFMGSLDLLTLRTLGIVCSVRLPGSIILEAFDFAKSVCGKGIAVVGGFHSPMERQCLEILLVRHVPLVICVGRRLATRRVPSSWQVPLAEGRLLLLSPFDDRKKRVTRDLAHQRNRFVMSLSDDLLVPFAAPGGRTEQVAREALRRDVPVWSFGVEMGEELFSLGVRQTDARRLVARLGGERPGWNSPPAPLLEPREG